MHKNIKTDSFNYHNHSWLGAGSALKDCHFLPYLGVWPGASCVNTWGQKLAQPLPVHGGVQRVTLLIF